jgi:hypothetical protein
MWVHPKLELKDRMQEHHVDPKQGNLAKGVTKVHEKDLSFKGERNEAQLRVVLDLVTFQFFLFV